MGYLTRANTTDYSEELAKLQKLRSDEVALALQAEADINRAKFNNEKQLLDKKLANLTKLKNAGLAISQQEVKAQQKAIEDKYALEKKKATEAAKNKIKDTEKLNKELEKIEKEYTERIAKEQEAAQKKYDTTMKTLKRAEQAEAARESKESATRNFSSVFASGKSLAERRSEWQQMSASDKLSGAIGALADFTKQLNQSIDSIAKTKSVIDTNLQGSRGKKLLGSYWDQFSQDIVGIAGVSPLVRQSDVVSNLTSMVGKGIAFNVEQRAFLQTISDKIATTFDANDAALTKLIRIQQQDTTAARLGMESALTAFLNNMYETSEYMHEMANGIRNDLYEASALMTAKSATEFEYQVQKWMGSLYSVGMSSSAVQSIAGTLGKIASGQVSGITGGGVSNLLLMAANEAGISISEVLSNGLGNSKTNILLESVVNYLAKLYNSTSDSKLLAQQIANVYGVTASDLKAAATLATTGGGLSAVAGTGLTYSGMLSQLSKMANSMYARTSIGELMTNATDNLKYSLAAGIAANPVLYGIYKMSNMLDDLVGGIALPDIKVMGTGVNLQTTVADLMKVASLSGSALGAMGQMLASGSGGGLSGSGILRALGIDLSGNGLTTVTRGNGGTGLIRSGGTTSESGYIGNTSGEDVLNKTMSDANQSKKEQQVEATDESSEVTLSTVDEHVVSIYNLLQDVVDGTSKLTVTFGETGWTNAGYLGAAGTNF